MREKRMLLIVLLALIPCLMGCHYLVPGSIKRQTNLVSLDVKTALNEIKEIDKDENKPEEQRLKEIRDKSLIVLERLKPQVQNIDDYTHGRPASPLEGR